MCIRDRLIPLHPETKGEQKIQAAADDGKRAAVGAVSYTHLDVYKRQDLNWWHWNDEPEEANRAMARRYQQPVSYTHLDVYKRQPLRLMLWRIPFLLIMCWYFLC